MLGCGMGGVNWPSGDQSEPRMISCAARTLGRRAGISWTKAHPELVHAPLPNGLCGPAVRWCSVSRKAAVRWPCPGSRTPRGAGWPIRRQPSQVLRKSPGMETKAGEKEGDDIRGLVVRPSTKGWSFRHCLRSSIRRVMAMLLLLLALILQQDPRCRHTLTAVVPGSAPSPDDDPSLFSPLTCLVSPARCDRPGAR